MNSRNALVSPLPTSVLDTLRRAKKLIFKRENWTQRAFARDANDDNVEARSPGAVKWCMLGAVWNVIPHDVADKSKFHNSLRSGAMNLLYEAIDQNYTLQHYNDTHEHKDILLMFDVAIQLAGGPPR